MPEVSVAEEVGMPFKERYEYALDSFRELQALLQFLSTEAVQVRQEQVWRREKRLAMFNGPNRRYMEKFVEGLDDEDIKDQEMSYQERWKEGVHLAREVYGFDATDSALKVIEAEPGGH